MTYLVPDPARELAGLFADRWITETLRRAVEMDGAVLRGYASHFGGPHDVDSGLELQPVALLSVSAVDLDPAGHYCAMRWDAWRNFKDPTLNPGARYTVAMTRAHTVVLFDEQLNYVLLAPIDYGPAISTRKLIDVSPGIYQEFIAPDDSQFVWPDGFVHLALLDPNGSPAVWTPTEAKQPRYERFVGGRWVPS